MCKSINKCSALYWTVWVQLSSNHNSIFWVPATYPGEAAAAVESFSSLRYECSESKTELVIDSIKTTALKCPTALPFITPERRRLHCPRMMTTSCWFLPPQHHTEVLHRDFPLAMTIAAGRVGLPLLIPKLVSHFREVAQLAARQSFIRLHPLYP